MKKSILFFILLTCVSFAQEKQFSFTKDGITDFTVTPVEGKTAAELYTLTLQWLNSYYRDPEKVIKAKVENVSIRVFASCRNLICFNTLGKRYYDSSYSFEISFKDGKYKFDVLEVFLLNTNSDPVMTLTDMSEYYKPSGELKSMYKHYPNSFTTFFNEMNANLESYILKETPAQKKEW